MPQTSLPVPAAGAIVKIPSTFLAVCLCATAVSANCQSADLKATLAGITQRGRALYAYDQAATYGTDAIFALKPETEGLTHYICLRTPKGWRVIFPKWNEAHTSVVVAYDAIETAPNKFEAHKINPPKMGDKELQTSELALELAIHDFVQPKRPYNTAILPAPGGNFYVYLYPGQIKNNTWPIGGDMRYTISADGQHIIDKRPLHKSILDAQAQPGSNEVAGYHFHVLTNLPEDTDVLYVLSRKPSMPEYIGIEDMMKSSEVKKFFLVNTDGSITTASEKDIPANKKK
jgi:hypothetical protein